MAVFEGSRYRNAALLRVQCADGEFRPALYSMIAASPHTARYTYTRIDEATRYDLLAWKLWRDPELWWAIADLNPEYLFPAEIPAGSVIRLPA